jgi:hypothetical protein
VNILLGVAECSLSSFCTGRVDWYNAAGLQALRTLCAAAGSSRPGYRATSCLCLGFTLLLAWIWWKGGGAADTRRGLRRLQRSTL